MTGNNPSVGSSARLAIPIILVPGDVSVIDVEALKVVKSIKVGR